MMTHMNQQYDSIMNIPTTRRHRLVSAHLDSLKKQQQAEKDAISRSNAKSRRR